MNESISITREDSRNLPALTPSRFCGWWGALFVCGAVGMLNLTACTASTEIPLVRPVKDQLSAKAVEMAKSDFCGKWTWCSDSWVIQYKIGPVRSPFTPVLTAGNVPQGDGYVQLTNVSCEVLYNQISEADRLNGIQWKGGVEFRATAARIYGQIGYAANRKGWSLWEDGGPIYRYFLTLQNNQWKMDGILEGPYGIPGFRPKMQLLAASCDLIFGAGSTNGK